MNKLDIKDISKDKILCSRVIFMNQSVSTNMRFGIGYDTYFNEDGIRIVQYGVNKLQKYEDQLPIVKFDIPYQEISNITLSISRKPVNKLFLVKPYDYSLDIIINMNSNFCSHSIVLETQAFSLLKCICDYLLDKKVTIFDPMEILNEYTSDNYELIKEKLNRDYIQLKDQYDLVNFRITDSRI